MHDTPCYCGSAAPFADCCAVLLRGEKVALTAEQLMRSRYSGYVCGDERYLQATWHPQTRPSRVRCDPDVRWLGLRIRACDAGQATDEAGVVEFVARCKQGGRATRLHERSEFRKLDGRWYYLSGVHL